MTSPIQITYRNVESSPDIDGLIRERIEKLERFAPRITRGHVVVESPHRRHRTGNAYLVRVDVHVPGGEFVASHESDPDRNETLASCVRDAFSALERELHSHVERRRDARRSESGPIQAS